MISQDLATIKQMVAELPDYLLSDVLYWQMQAANDFPKLSLGLLLLTQARLKSARAQLSAAQQIESEQVNRDLDAILARWPVAAENKAGKELRSRLNLWQAFLADCQEEPSTCADHYPHEVAQRAIAALLLRQFPRLAASLEAQRLAALDGQLRRRLKGGAFVWAAELQAGFPQPEFWFLYGLS